MPTAVNARISRVHGSWRVRVPSYPARFFADSAFGGGRGALAAARTWRDERWDGVDLNRKLTEKQKKEIRRSSEHYITIAERYGISSNYVHQIRREV